MSPIQISIGDHIRIADYGGEYVVEGTVIAKSSKGVTVMVEPNHHLFFNEDYFDENVQITIVQKASTRVLVEEVRRITPKPRVIGELQEGDGILVKYGQLLTRGKVACQTNVFVDVRTSPNSRTYFKWKDLGKDTRVTIIRKMPDNTWET